MKIATQELMDLLANGRFWMADCYEVALAGGGPVLRYTSADVDVTVSGNVYSASGPRFQRSRCRWHVGVEVDTLEVEIFPRAQDLVLGLPFLHALDKGLLDGSEWTLRRAFAPAPGQAVTGALVMFAGRMGSPEAGRTSALCRINSHTELLNIKLPKRVVQPGCIWTLYEPGCGVSRSAWTEYVTVQAGSTPSMLLVSGTSRSWGWFALGMAQGVIGANASLARYVSSYAPGAVYLVPDLPFTPAAGDVFSLAPGCSKTIERCQQLGGRFRGYPYVPVPETTL